MGKKFIIQPYGSISVDLIEGKIKVISLSPDLKDKFKAKYPEGIIGNASNYTDDKKLLRLIRKVFKSLSDNDQQ